ncbi:porin family protein [Oceanimonas sp. CHS3-5]|uniref:porin family protein n=1 Tax=Oceanimonas sp. CHS3-5 TaxID=3068186 RepID=UPI00273FB103|nr:porin family protein [Oceanimonas sp. CHS3-5]MDP5293635.1 porin family protein [Oceanimonas sp. CHS3-5]
MKIKALIAASCLLAAGAQAQGYGSTPMMYSQPEFYLGLNYAQMSFEIEDDEIEDALDESVDWNTVGINLGVQPSPYLALEGRYGKGIGSEDIAGVIDTKLKHYFGFYALPQIPIQDYMSVYALLGWTKAKAEATSEFFPAFGVPYKISDSEDDFSYGIGVRFRDMRNPNGVAFFAEYARLINRGDYDINGMMFGLSWHF